ncbi:uncharacterized protein LOC111885546 [Lactuca sativa]|uniref:uncharacterized protein LOC111885546 n=1 Tax=Lactuca sativa TaxID=4236 RepID=UPI000CD8E979|nr:uncharacterized protein LOC111885546 [Lactuca sativa]
MSIEKDSSKKLEKEKTNYKVIKSGDNTQFWHDFWIGTCKLKTAFPSLYALESKKRFKVSIRILADEIKWDWSSCPINVGLTTELENLTKAITTIQLQPGLDETKCKLSHDGNYMVHMLRQRIDQTLPVNNQQAMIKWSKLVPIKVTCFVWRAIQGRIPSVVALSHRGINLDSTICGSCIDGPECANHIIISCPFAVMVREMIFKWCGINLSEVNEVVDIEEFAAKWGKQYKKRKRLITI